VTRKIIYTDPRG